MVFTFCTVRFLIFQPGINRYRFYVSISIIFLKGTDGIFTFKKNDCVNKSMDGFIYVGVSDSVTAEKVNKIIRTDVIPSSGEDYEDVISRVLSAFLGTPYQADTLIGGPGTLEALVVNFNGVDCFTLADYVEAHDPQP
nr:N-acetylmuramoyl-L-alanine amidase-like domain-containing protein [Enterobacter cancerogenus]